MKRLGLMFFLALKDLRHNGKSSLLILLVVATICLPTTIILSLREGYVVLFKDWIERTTPAKQLDINVDVISDESLDINKRLISKWKSETAIEKVIPHIRLGAFTDSKSGGFEKFDLISTLPDDPELKRLSIGGAFNDSHIGSSGVIVPSYFLKEKKLEIGDKIPIYLERGIQKRMVEIPILDTINIRKGKKVFYGTLKLLNHYEYWVKGYGITDKDEGVFLPPSKDREEALGSVSAMEATIYKKLPFSDEHRRLLSESYGLEVRYDKDEDNFLGICKKKNGRSMGESDWDLIEKSLTDAFDAVVVPNVISPQFISDKKKYVGIPTSPVDPRLQFRLVAGQWISNGNSRIEVLLSEKEYGSIEEKKEGRIIKVELGEEEIEFEVTGAHDGNDNEIFLDFNSLYRFKQLESGEARFIPKTGLFEPNEEVNYETRGYKIARVHVKTLEDVVETYTMLESSGFDIPSSSKSDIEHYLEIKRILTGFVLLLAIVGAIACIGALFVLMYEAIKRKESQIGILKAIGIDNAFIINTYTIQCIVFGVFGLILSLVIFFIMSFFLDSSLGHTMFNMPDQEGQIFQMTPFLFFLMIGGVVVVSLIAGRLATLTVKSMNPADILINN